jgi:phage baseplate assembly protein W
MAIELGKISVKDLIQNQYKGLSIGFSNSDTDGLFQKNYSTRKQYAENIKNLILTRKGERIMNPLFGCDIHRVLFEPIVEGQIENKIEAAIEQAVNYWIPEVNIDEIIFDFTENDIDNHTINFNIVFSLKSNPDITDNVEVSIKE